TPEYNWSITSGGVPGLSLDPVTGTISGTPATAGSYTFAVTVSDSTGTAASKSFSVTINPSLLTLTTSRDLPPGIVGTEVTQQFQASGGLPPYTWSANGLPDGLSLDPTTGILSGKAVLPGTFSFTVRVTDAARTTVVDLFRVVIGVPTLPSLNLSGLETVSE